MIPVTVQTLVVAPSPNPSVLVLCPTADYEAHTNCRIVPIWMGAAEASQIGIALEGVKLARPLTHDLMLDALTNLDAAINHVEIYDVVRHTFFARLVLHAGERVVSLDARPSDAIALALRQGASLYMAENVLNSASFPFVFRKDKNDEKELDEFRDFVQTLSPEDFEE